MDHFTPWNLKQNELQLWHLKLSQFSLLTLHPWWVFSELYTPFDKKEEVGKQMGVLLAAASLVKENNVCLVEKMKWGEDDF